MRITTRLKITSGLILAVLALLIPILILTFNDFESAKSNDVLATNIKDAFFENEFIRNQYLLYREDLLRVQWETTKEESDRLLREAVVQFHREEDQQLLQKMRINAGERKEVFLRIVSNTNAQQTSLGKSLVFGELHQRLASQLLLRAASFRNMADELQQTSEQRVEQTYQRLVVSVGLLAFLLVLVTLLTARQISRSIHRGLLPLHDGALAVIHGDLDYRIKSDGTDEFAELVNYFNDMTNRLQASIVQLEAELQAHRQSEEKLSILNRNFVAFLDNTSDFIYFKDENARFCFCSQTLADITGHACWRDMIGKHDSEVFPQDTAQIYIEEEGPVFRDGKPLLNKVDPYHDVVGNLGWVSTNKWPLINDQGQVIGLFGISRDITEQKKTADTLDKALDRLKKITSRVPGMVVFQLRQRSDGSFCVPYASDALNDIYRVSPEAVREDATPLFAPVHPDDLPQFLASLSASACNMLPWLHEYRLKFADAPEITLVTNALPQREADGSLLWCGFITDISERKKAENKLKLTASVFVHAHEGILITDADATIMDANKAFTDITSYPLHEVLGKNPRILSSGRHEKSFYTTLWGNLIEKGHWYGEVWNRRNNGEVYTVMQNISAVRDAQGNTQHYVALFSDITSTKAHESQLEHLAHYDTLTSLPNRALLADRLHQCMAQTQRHGHMMAVAFLDLDGFKCVNDNHGHHVGDHILITVSGRMKQVLREGDTLARIGGDEFVAVLNDLENMSASVLMLDRLLAAAAEPLFVGNLMLNVSASIGVTFYPQADVVEPDQLLRQADQAMYQAKLLGRNRFHIFDPKLDRDVRGRLEGQERIRHALGAGEFMLYYQPKVNARQGIVVGAEALIRWQHPERGLLPPAEFLPMIDDHPLAIDIGEWVIDSALGQMATWQQDGLHIPVSVNVGARQLQQSDFVDRLCVLLAKYPQVSPGDLKLEILETSALQDLSRVSHFIELCREVGVTFSLDDFGTGYSSLTYLKRLAVAELKIDQSFVFGMLDDPDDLAILEGVLNLANAFRRQVIAEGVETSEHGEMLLRLGCELFQGYGVARPMPADHLPKWVAAWCPNPLWVSLPSVNRVDLPLLFAGAEYRAWIAVISDCLEGKRKAPPLDHKHFRFGIWLENEGVAHHGAQTAFRAIEPLHQQLHALAAQLLQLQATGLGQHALARLPELYELRDSLLEQLRELMPVARASDLRPHQTPMASR